MPNRLIRDELLETEQWLFLPSDTNRLVFIGLIFPPTISATSRAGLETLLPVYADFAQVKNEENAATVILHLADANLVRRYELEGRDFFHVPRFRPHRKCLVRKCPPSGPGATAQRSQANKRKSLQFKG